MESGSRTGSIVTIVGEQAHHIHSVLRLPQGAAIEVLDTSAVDSPEAFTCSLAEIRPREAKADLESPLQIPAALPIHIMVGLAKPKTCDTIVEKCVELGVSSISFFQAERSQGSLKTARLKEKLPRFDRIAASAMKQSGFQEPLPRIKILPSLAEAMKYHAGRQQERNAPDIKILLSTASARFEQASDNTTFSPSFRLTEALVEKSPENAECYLVVGPEGGLSESEERAALDHGYTAASLGRKVLRVETAATAAAAIASAMLGNS